MNPTSFNTWKLVSLSPLPHWAVLGLIALVCAGAVLAAFGVRKEPSRPKRWVLWLLRGLAAVAAIFLLLEPGVRDVQVARMKSRLAVLIDRSASMAFPTDDEGHTRTTEVSDFLRRAAPDFERLKDRYQIELYGFDPELSPTSPEALLQKPPTGARTDLLSALRSLHAGSEGGTKKLAGVILLSDGADNAELGQGLQGSLKQALSGLEAPVSTFAVGHGGLRDLAIQRVKVDDFAFVRNQLTVEVEVRGRGFSGKSVPVTLSQENQTVGSRTITLRSDDDVQTVTFSFTPDQTGRFVYTAEVPVFPGEVVKENNARSFVLKVIRDRIRVLLVVGRPSWDERYLRGLLRQDPNVDLVSFYILRTGNENANVVDPEHELSLIPFPTEEIFQKKLHTFDVVIFQNFGYTEPSLSVALYEGNLEQYVKNGGGFVMIGGDSSFGDGRATFPTLMQAMPVEPSGLSASEDAFPARLTAEGARHPVTSIGGPGGSSEAAWAQLPPLPGANLTRLRPGATALLEHPFAKVDGKPAPILALWEYGRGRSMALCTDGAWKWEFTARGGSSAERPYDKLWSNVLRWLVRDPELTRLQVLADPPQVEPGHPVVAKVTARLGDYQPAAGARVHGELYSLQARKVVGQVDATAGDDGVARLELSPPGPGAYKIVAKATRGDQSLGEGEDAVAVRAVGPELADAQVRPELLEQIANATGGRAYTLPQEGLPNVPLLEPPLVEVGRSKDRPLWDRWYYLVTLVALLGAEWFLRRRFGYI